jgi:hypothetical protein
MSIVKALADRFHVIGPDYPAMGYWADPNKRGATYVDQRQRARPISR